MRMFFFKLVNITHIRIVTLYYKLNSVYNIKTWALETLKTVIKVFIVKQNFNLKILKGFYLIQMFDFLTVFILYIINPVYLKPKTFF